MPEDRDRYSAAWPQFLSAKRALLAEYDQALTHSAKQAVHTHHGVVGEAAVRDWLDTFLPKRYGVASGFIRSQGLPTPHQTAHFDVIIYDRLEAPTLWIELNKDKSESGRVRIIPVEHVRAIIEIKAAFNRRAVRDAITKLGELAPLVTGVNGLDNWYPRYLPASTALAMMFFELRVADRSDIEALNLLGNIELGRAFYGALILRGKGRHPDDSAIVQQYRSDQPIPEVLPSSGLLEGFVMTPSAVPNGSRTGTSLMWADVNFSKFAFDLLALLNGTYRSGFASSLHGLEIQGGGEAQ